MKNNYAIHIPSPCHENWDAMIPVQQGRFCQSCAKQVVDFSMMTDQEVLNYFSKATGNTCGRFNNDQLQRPLQPTKIEKKKTWWVAAMMPLLMLFTKAMSQKKEKGKNIIKMNQSVTGMGDVVITRVSNPTDYWPVQSDETEAVIQAPMEKCKIQATKLIVERKKGSADFIVSGTIIDSYLDAPLPYATVAIKGSNTAVLADSAGNFSIKGRTTGNRAVLVTSAVGFETTNVLVQIKDTVDEVNHIVNGIVVDANNNHPVANATIILTHTKTKTQTGEDGIFSLVVNDKVKHPSISIISVGYMDAKLSIPAETNNSIINFDTIKLNASIPTDDIVVVGGMTVCTYSNSKKTGTIPTFIRKFFHTDAFKFYPNPALSGGLLTIDIRNEGNYSIQLYSSDGKLIMADPFEAIKDTTQTSITIPPGLTPGVYYIRLFDNKTKKQYTDKLTIM